MPKTVVIILGKTTDSKSKGNIPFLKNTWLSMSVRFSWPIFLLQNSSLQWIIVLGILKVISFCFTVVFKLGNVYKRTVTSILPGRMRTHGFKRINFQNPYFSKIPSSICLSSPVLRSSFQQTNQTPYFYFAALSFTSFYFAAERHHSHPSQIYCATLPGAMNSTGGPWKGPTWYMG